MGESGIVIGTYKVGQNKSYATVALDFGGTKKYNTLSLKFEFEEGITYIGGNLVENNCMVAMVKFIGGYNDSKYRQFALYEDAKIGDYVLCDNAGGYTLGIIGELLTYEGAKEKNKIPTKEIICVCDFTAFNGRKERKEKANKIKAEMDKRIKELQASQIYEMFAEKDDVLRGLLEEYKGVVG